MSKIFKIDETRKHLSIKCDDYNEINSKELDDIYSKYEEYWLISIRSKSSRISLNIQREKLTKARIREFFRDYGAIEYMERMIDNPKTLKALGENQKLILNQNRNNSIKKTSLHQSARQREQANTK